MSGGRKNLRLMNSRPINENARCYGARRPVGWCRSCTACCWATRDPGADAGGCGGERDRPATALVHRDVEDPAVSPARVSGESPGSVAVVSQRGSGGRGGSAGGASGPDQPPRHQTEDEQLEEEEARASQLSSTPQGI